MPQQTAVHASARCGCPPGQSGRGTGRGGVREDEYRVVVTVSTIAVVARGAARSTAAQSVRNDQPASVRDLRLLPALQLSAAHHDQQPPGR
jgi:hypothetical protein